MPARTLALDTLALTAPDAVVASAVIDDRVDAARVATALDAVN